MKEQLKALFFEETIRTWHFEALLKQSRMSRERLNTYLKQLIKEDFVQRIKPKGKMPYYKALDTPRFQAEKRLFGISLLEECGLLDFIRQNPDVKTAILFGSFSRGDWSKSSDVDLFIYGKNPEIDFSAYERKLSREIQVFSYSTPEHIRELDAHLLPNILKGFHLTQSIEPFKITVDETARPI